MKNKKIAFLLCLLLGWFGIHRFYLKKYKTAITMLIITSFCFILTNIKNPIIDNIIGFFMSIIAIWCFVDLILILLNKFDFKPSYKATDEEIKAYIEDKYKISVESIERKDKKVSAILESNQIYSDKKPAIIDFIDYQDYRLLLNFYSIYQRNNIDKLMKKPYPYNKYDWNTLMQIIWTNQYFYKHLQEFQKIGIKKVQLCCNFHCECCKDILNKEIQIDQVKELPMKECEFNVRICQTAFYKPVIVF